MWYKRQGEHGSEVERQDHAAIEAAAIIAAASASSLNATARRYLEASERRLGEIKRLPRGESIARPGTTPTPTPVSYPHLTLSTNYPLYVLLLAGP